MAVTDQLSGIVLNQNATASGSIDWRGSAYGSETIYQTFFLPSHYEMGTTDVELRHPDLSGFQVLVNIDEGYASAATLDLTLDLRILGRGWINLIAGTAIGAHADGTVWFDLLLPEPLTITAALADSLFRIGVTTRAAEQQALAQPVQILSPNNYRIDNVGITAVLTEDVPYAITVGGQPGFLLLHDAEVTFSVQQGVGKLFYVAPNPLGFKGQAFQSDGVTPLLGTGPTASLNFRLLALTADSGVDFLGNEYRSCVVQDSGGNSTTSNPSWMSPPQPSQFAVLSRYYDIRPSPAQPPLGTINLMLNPSFEWDAPAQAPFGWGEFDSSVTVRAFAVQGTWAASGAQSCRLTAIAPANSTYTPGWYTSDEAIPVVAGQPYSGAATVNILENDGPNSLTIMAVRWFDINDVLINTSIGGSTTGTGTATLTVTDTAPATAATARVLIYTTLNALGQGFDGFLDAAIFSPGSTVPTYGDGDALNWEWTAQRGRSISTQLLPVEPDDDTTVVDGVLVDPLTPNIAFNVYYSIDDSGNGPNMTERDWEQKLWIRVPQVYIATQRQQYVFPQPVVAKYVKVEFTNLQAQTYNPGNFQQATTYKKYPTWVADFFVAQLESPSFIANQVNVQNDALTFAYAYYLDDLDQSPAQPVSAPPSQIPNLSSFFSQSDAQGLVDASTLSRINLVMQQFQAPTGSLLSTASVLGKYGIHAFNATTAATPTTSEQPTAPAINYSAVSSLLREPVVFEQSLPVMFFFLTCRHTYKELSAQFEYNRAYFAGVNDIQFLRHNYETNTDTALYVESGGDNFNAELNDFVIDTDGNWYTY